MKHQSRNGGCYRAERRKLIVVRFRQPEERVDRTNGPNKHEIVKASKRSNNADRDKRTTCVYRLPTVINKRENGRDDG